MEKRSITAPRIREPPHPHDTRYQQTQERKGVIRRKQQPYTVTDDSILEEITRDVRRRRKEAVVEAEEQAKAVVEAMGLRKRKQEPRGSRSEDKEESKLGSGNGWSSRMLLNRRPSVYMAEKQTGLSWKQNHEMKMYHERLEQLRLLEKLIDREAEFAEPKKTQAYALFGKYLEQRNVPSSVFVTKASDNQKKKTKSPMRLGGAGSQQSVKP
jgi:hypothetical protein